jgi:hypothetical protein
VAFCLKKKQADFIVLDQSGHLLKAGEKEIHLLGSKILIPALDQSCI